MGPPISSADREWISRQHVFFHASAPLGPRGRVNLSPKSAKQFRVVNDNTVCWLDYSGSGAETAAHIMENGRLTIMFVSFEGSPKILRLFGTGYFILPEDLTNPENSVFCDLFAGELPGQENYDPGFRCIVVLTVDRATHSCGYSIPFFNYISERPTLNEFSCKKGDEGMKIYRALKNSFSIDGLPGIGQLLMKQLPTAMTDNCGYYFAEYDGSWYGKLKTMIISLNYRWVHTGSLGWKIRDGGILCLGIALGILAPKFVSKLK